VTAEQVAVDELDLAELVEQAGGRGRSRVDGGVGAPPGEDIAAGPGGLPARAAAGDHALPLPFTESWSYVFAGVN
jgi:hypothetical protein